MAASPNVADSNPRSLVELTGAIVVAANYRIGPLGFMGHPALTAEDPAYHSSGNYGLLDQRAAMAWVRDNIAAFGGDPDNVTIAGQSAGGHSVSFHIVSPGSASYFHRAIIQSGYASARQPTLADAEALGTGFAAGVGCTDPAQVVACMRGKTPMQVLLAFPNGQQEFAQTPRIAWGPVVDGLDIPDQPRSLYESGAFNRVPTIIGSTRDEGWIYADRSYPGGLTTAQYRSGCDWRIRRLRSCDPGAVSSRRFPVTKAGAVTTGRRRRSDVRSAQSRAACRAHRDSCLSVLLRA